MRKNILTIVLFAGMLGGVGYIGYLCDQATYKQYQKEVAAIQEQQAQGRCLACPSPYLPRPIFGYVAR